MAPPVRLGTLTIIATPIHYGDTVDFAFTLPKRPRNPVIGVYCTQGGQYRYISELGADRTLESTTHGEIQIDNQNSSAMPGKLDYTAPCECFGVMWDEFASGQQPQVITNATPRFTVLP